MSYVSYNELLAYTTVTRAISRLKVPGTRFQDFMGMAPGGANVNPVGGHHAGYDIFNTVRDIATGRAPGVGPATVKAQSIGHVPVTIARAHEKMPLLAERVFRRRPLGRNWGEVDITGQNYVTKQESILAQHFKNWREFMVSRMLRGGFMLKQSGDDWIPVDAGGHITIDYQIPAGNKLKLDLLGAGDIIGASWATAGTSILGDYMEINAAYEQLHGWPINHTWMNSYTFKNTILANTELHTLGGSSNIVWNQFDRASGRLPDGLPENGFEVVMKGMPWMTFHIYDAGLNIDGTYTKFLPNNYAVICPDPSASWAELYEGSELVMENAMSGATERFGLAAWTEGMTQPPGWELLSVDNCIPVLYVPSAVCYATVIF